MSNMLIYMFGVLLVAFAAGYAAHLIGVSSTWIAIVALLIIGMGTMGGVAKTRRHETSSDEE